MSFPNFAGKHEHDSFINPSDFIAHLRRHGVLPEFTPPRGVVFLYQRRLLAEIREREPTTIVIPATMPLYLLGRYDGAVGICGGFGVGAPVAAAMLELLVAVGVRRFANIGIAGSLQPQVPIAGTVLCNRAIRDEGVSHHYLPPGMYAEPSPDLTSALGRQLLERGIEFTTGPSWTIDTIYRETVAEVRHYQAQGVLTVEMEASAMFAVSAFRGVDIAAAFVISDSLADVAWDPQFLNPDVDAALHRLFDAACATLAAAP